MTRPYESEPEPHGILGRRQVSSQRLSKSLTVRSGSGATEEGKLTYFRTRTAVGGHSMMSLLSDTRLHCSVRVILSTFLHNPLTNILSSFLFPFLSSQVVAQYILVVNDNFLNLLLSNDDIIQCVCEG